MRVSERVRLRVRVHVRVHRVRQVGRGSRGEGGWRTTASAQVLMVATNAARRYCTWAAEMATIAKKVK